jgi:hypothetical protein
MQTLLSFAILALPATLPAQRTWVVSRAGGPGVDFVDLPPAIAAAAPGDRVVVLLGETYSPFVVDKGVHVEALQGAGVPRFRVEGVPAGQAASVSGFLVRGAVPSDRAEVHDCAGAVLLARLTIEYRGGADFPTHELDVVDSADLLVVDCLVSGSFGGQGPGADAARVVRSRLCLQRSRLWGGYGGRTASNAAGFDGGTALTLEQSDAFVFDAELHGGGGNYGLFVSGDGGDAVRLLGAVPDRATFSRSTIARGDAGGPNAMNGFAVRGPARATSDCAITGETTPDVVTVPAITTLDSPGTVARGSTLTLQLTGPAATVVLMNVDVRHGFAFLPGLGEPFLLELGSVPLRGVVLDSLGRCDYAVPVPSDVPPGLDVFFQGVALEPLGRITLTPLGDVHVDW